MSALDEPRPLRRPGDTDAVTFSFADVEAGLYGLLRVASGLDGDGAPSSSALGIAFAGREIVGALAEAGETPPPELVASTEAPLERWAVNCEPLGLALTFEALSAPVIYNKALVKAGGMEGYEQLCRAEGRVGGRPLRGLGQRGHTWGNPDWDKIALTRAVGAWFDDASGLALGLVRGVKASSHADEAAWGASFTADGSFEVDEVRLSTTFDEAGRQIRAGLELWLERDAEYPHRGQGEVVTGSTLELGALRLDVAFMRWHIEGRTGIGRYDVLRRA